MEPSQFLSALLVSASTRALDEQQQQQAPKSSAANTRSTRGSLSVVSPLAAAPASAAAPAFTGAMLNRACLQAAVAASCSHSEAAAELQALLLRLRPALERRRLPFDASFFAALVHSVRYATYALVAICASAADAPIPLILYLYKVHYTRICTVEYIGIIHRAEIDAHSIFL